jgi:hypothetical protein
VISYAKVLGNEYIVFIENNMKNYSCEIFARFLDGEAIIVNFKKKII